MIYLLDVNALVALGFLQHEFHAPAAAWVARVAPELATCAITELGFVRVLAQAEQYGLTVAQGQTVLTRMKASKIVRFHFFADSLDVSGLPAWVKTPAQTTDGHLLQLAKEHGSALATFDRKIPGAFLIPSR